MKSDKSDFTQGSILQKLVLLCCPFWVHWCCRPLTAR